LALLHRHEKFAREKLFNKTFVLTEQLPPNQEDLMTAYHLLLCVVDYVYTALEQISTNSPYTTTGNLHRLLNPAFGLEIFSLKKLQ
jgi:hypothetical protein